MTQEDADPHQNVTRTADDDDRMTTTEEGPGWLTVRRT
jgi:hypothetical protein